MIATKHLTPELESFHPPPHVLLFEKALDTELGVKGVRRVDVGAKLATPFKIWEQASFASWYVGTSNAESACWIVPLVAHRPIQSHAMVDEWWVCVFD
jgi:hypothetical protein